MGGKTAFSGRCDGEWWWGVGGCEINEFVIDAIRCKGLTEADGEKSSGGKIELPNGELLADMEPKTRNMIIIKYETATSTRGLKFSKKQPH